VPECQEIEKGGLDQYGHECFGRVIFATIRKSVGLKGLNCLPQYLYAHCAVLLKPQWQGQGTAPLDHISPM